MVVEEFGSVSEFKAQRLSNDFSIVNFSADWCHHSIQFNKIFDVIATKYASPSVKFFRATHVRGKTESLANKLCEEENIQGFPATRVYQRGKIIKTVSGNDESSLSTVLDDIQARYSKPIRELSNKQLGKVVREQRGTVVLTKCVNMEDLRREVRRRVRARVGERVQGRLAWATRTCSLAPPCSLSSEEKIVRAWFVKALVPRSVC